MDQGENMIGGFAPRKIDELLRNPFSDLVDILSDEEAISEFRSGNPQLVSRVTASNGMTLIVNLLTNQDLPQSLTEQQRLQLPFIASELVACEVDALLDAFSREAPGHLSPQARLMEFLIEGSECNPTVLGYVVRALLVLTNRRVSAVNKYVSDHEKVLSDALLDLMADKSVADLFFRFCLDEDIKGFRPDFNGLFSRLNSENADNCIWLMDMIFGKPIMGNEERLQSVFDCLKIDFVDKNGLHALLQKASQNEDEITSRAAMDILSILIQFSFTRPVITASAVSNSAWETFAAPAPSKNRFTIEDDEDDSCVFDDDMSPKPTVAPSRFGSSKYTDFGSLVVSACISFSPQTKSLSHLYSLMRLRARVIKYSDVRLTDNAKGIAESVTDAMYRYPNSSALHNACLDCIINDSLCEDEIRVFASVFVPRAIEYLRSTSEISGGVRGHLNRILAYLSTVLGNDLPTTSEEDMAVIGQAIARWRETDCRLADRDKQVPSRAPSPQGATPIIDLDPAVGDQWTSMDFVASFPVENSPESDSYSPQVRQGSRSGVNTLTELSSSTDSWTSGRGIVDENI